MKDENESLHTTKEVLNLDELTESAINLYFCSKNEQSPMNTGIARF